MAHALQPKHSVWIYRTAAETFLRFTADVANPVGTSTTLYAKDDGTVSFTPSALAPDVNYIRNLTADPKVLKRIWTDTATGHSSVSVNDEATAPHISAYAIDAAAGAGVTVDVTPQGATVQASNNTQATMLQVAPDSIAGSTPSIVLSADTVRIEGKTASDAMQLVLGDINMDIFEPANNAVIIYDTATNAYRALDTVYTKQQIDMLFAGNGTNNTNTMPVPFSYTFVANQLTYPLPPDCTGLLYLTASTGQTVNPTSGWTVNAASKTFTLLGPMPSGTMYGYGLKPSTTISNFVNVLDFTFKAGFSNTYDTVISSSQAGLYRAYTFTNVLGAQYTINGIGATLPFKLSTGDTLKITVARTNANSGTTVALYT
jgi:hypothetical protein